MPFELAKLPYANDALSPFISAETVEYHYGKHHQTYVNNLNKLIEGSEYERKSLEEIIKNSSGSIFNNAAQVFNHDFYWQCLCPQSNEPSDRLLEAIKASFESLDNFKMRFNESALSLFGSGWTWAVLDGDGKIAIINTSNADNPIVYNKTPLLVCDVWEHAYYIDYHNARAKYLESFWKLVDWNFVAKCKEKSF